ncbi:hypothetical protein RIU97_01885 [Streptomyces sp. 147326]
MLVGAAVWSSGGGCSAAAAAWAAVALPLLLWGPVAVGLATAAVLAYCLATRPVTAEVRGRTIGYGVNVPWMPVVLTGHPFATLGALLLAGTGGCGPSVRCWPRGAGLLSAVAAGIRLHLVRRRRGRVRARPGLGTAPGNRSPAAR